jgi:rhodanese-related sulfurtransferase
VEAPAIDRGSITMQKPKVIWVWMLVGALFLAGCQAGAGRVQATTTAVAMVGNDYWGLVKQAQEAYTHANYEASMKFARQAVGLNPDEQTAWELYSQAVVAQAGDTYLSELPDHRYQLPVPVFLRDRINHTRDWLVIDVREPDEYAAGHIEGAVNIPLREILKNLDALPNGKTAPILLYCHSQKRATHALVILHELGYLKVFNLEGGYAAYEDWMNNNPLPTPGPTPTPGPDEPDFGC